MYEAPFLTMQFFKLNQPVEKPYAGSRQNQTGLLPRDVEELARSDSPTIGGMVRSLASLASDVGSMQTNIKSMQTSIRLMAWAIPALVGFGITVIGIIVSLK